MADNWKIKELFEFSKRPAWFINDSEELVYCDMSDGGSIPLKPNNMVKDKHIVEPILIQNNDIISCIDGKLHKEETEELNTDEVIKRISLLLYDGKVLTVEKFLKHHYKYSKRKGDFVKFIEYYILGRSSIKPEKKEQNIKNDEFLKNWIKGAKKRIWNIVYIEIVVVLALILALIYFNTSYQANVMSIVFALIVGVGGYFIRKITE